MALLITTLGVSAWVSATEPTTDTTQKDRFFQRHKMMMNGERGEIRDEMKEIMEIGDYEAWKAKMEERLAEMEQRHTEMVTKIKENITEEKFNQMKEVRALRQEGNFNEAKALAEEYGLEIGFGSGFGPKEGMRRGGMKLGNCRNSQQVQ